MHWRQRTRRRRSIDELGHAHMLTFSTHQRYRFLSAERTCVWLAAAIDEARRTLDFTLSAYVFMPDHVHLIVRPGAASSGISDLLRAIKLPVGQRATAYLREHSPEWLPRLEVRHGSRVEHHFWQSGGGFDRNIVDPNALGKMIDYIHANPVRKGLVQEAGEWKWSSAGWYAGREPNTLRPDPLDTDGLSLEIE